MLSKTKDLSKWIARFVRMAFVPTKSCQLSNVDTIFIGNVSKNGLQNIGRRALFVWGQLGVIEYWYVNVEKRSHFLIDGFKRCKFCVCKWVM